MIGRELEAFVADAYSGGVTRFGDLGLDLNTFRNRIASVIQKHLGHSRSTEKVKAFLKSMHGSDLYLTTACAQCGPGGGGEADDPGSSRQSSIPWKTFATTYGNYIRNLARLFHHSGFLAEDLANNILADLYLPDRSGASRIASYDGRSSLSTWLRVIVCNRAINVRRSNPDTPRRRETEIERHDEHALENIELTLRSRRYRLALEDSLRAACNALSGRERLILLWRYEHGLPLGHIARLLGIHQSNVTRQLGRIQARLRSDVITMLAERHGLSQPAIRECLEDIVENSGHAVSLLEFIKLTHYPFETPAKKPRRK